MNVILIGAQGSGKGTQSQLLAERLRLKPIASGDLLRDAIAHDTPLGKAAKPYMDRGDLVPDDLIVGLILESFDQLTDERGVILDGFPRTISQAHVLDSSLAGLAQRVDAAIYLEVRRQTLLDRLSGRYICRAHGHVWNTKTRIPRVAGICDFDGSELYQRADDTTETIAKRLDKFFTETIRLVDYYDRQGKLMRVNGEGDIERINTAIVTSLQPPAYIEDAMRVAG